MTNCVVTSSVNKRKKKNKKLKVTVTGNCFSYGVDFSLDVAVLFSLTNINISVSLEKIPKGMSSGQPCETLLHVLSFQSLLPGTGSKLAA